MKRAPVGSMESLEALETTEEAGDSTSPSPDSRYLQLGQRASPFRPPCSRETARRLRICHANCASKSSTTTLPLANNRRGWEPAARVGLPLLACPLFAKAMNVTVSCLGHHVWKHEVAMMSSGSDMWCDQRDAAIVRAKLLYDGGDA